jgi:hypothetical protein
MKTKEFFSTIVVGSILLSIVSYPQNKIQSSVIANGGAVISNGSNRISGTIGQSIIGRTSGQANLVKAGFWQQVNGLITGIESEDNKIIPKEFYLFQNYPNPFNPSTRIRWESPQSGLQILKVYDILGKEIATLVNEEKQAGRYEVKFDGASLSSGIYFYAFKTGNFVDTKKLILMK